MKKSNKKNGCTTQPQTKTGAIPSNVGFPRYSFNKLKTTSMKNSMIILLVLVASLMACNPPVETQEPQQQVQQVTPPAPTEQPQTVRLVFIADRSGSFIKQYTHPDPALFKPLCDKIHNAAMTVDFRYGVITEYSDIVFDRYYVPYVVKEVKAVNQQETDNPWLASEDTTTPIEAPTQQPADWNSFAANVNAKLAGSPSNASDVASAISRAILFFQEQGGNTRNILFLCTDGADTYRQLPNVPTGVEIVTVGITADNHIEQALNTSNIKRFENLQAAIDYLIFHTL